MVRDRTLARRSLTIWEKQMYNPLTETIEAYVCLLLNKYITPTFKIRPILEYVSINELSYFQKCFQPKSLNDI
jgi:hypothetical protein